MALLLVFASLLLLASATVDDTFLCARDNVRVNTVIGIAAGNVGTNGVVRFAVKYANAKRWSPSSPSKLWQLPNGASDATAMPLPCPQPGVANSTEDCLSMVLYVPNNVEHMPVMLWIHGGSFIVGSASDPILDGSKLAAATGSIVAVVQHRLGALGFMDPKGQTNLAVKDIVSALNFLWNVVPCFGGDKNRITVAGQSSGGNMVRALLAVPSAQSLFCNAIIESDPMDFGFLSVATQSKLQNYFNSKIGCAPTDSSCLQSLSVDAIINAELDLFQNAPSIDPSAGSAEPMRPVRDNSFITSPLDSTAPFPHVSKPVLITTVLNEATEAAYSIFPNPVPQSDYQSAVQTLLGPDRSGKVMASSFYVSSQDTAVDVRQLLEQLLTDFVWRCPSWTFARNWVANGGKAFVGRYRIGATYPSNAAIPLCTKGNVCHQDDIPIVFGTAQNPNAAQKALIAEIQSRYKSFLNGGQPNAAGFPQWVPSGTSKTHALDIGGSGEVPVGACDPNFWGSQVPYDYQIFNI